MVVNAPLTKLPLHTITQTASKKCDHVATAVQKCDHVATAVQK